ncbi:MAG: 50S ribosomal protein L17 [Syntrophobacterales bacterium]|nr:50S ribosomal protein L17 [Syntrophobacterales bacterium]
MRHGKADCKLGRTTSHRKAMLRNMVTSFIDKESIQTTDVKAKELRKVAEKMVTLGKRGSLHARRQALAYVRSTAAVQKLFDDLSLRYRDRAGGYTRIVKLGYRNGDNAPISLVEFVVKDEGKEKGKKKPAAKKS